MSELFIVLCFIIFLSKQKTNVQKRTVSLSVFVRPILAVGMSILILQKRSIKQLSAFCL